VLPPEFLLYVLPNNGFSDRYVLADDLPSVMRLPAESAPAAQSAAVVQMAASVPSKRDKNMGLEVYVPDLLALVEKAGAAGAKQSIAALTEVARQLGEIDDPLLRELAEIGEALGNLRT
jgi:hypothetical protein